MGTRPRVEYTLYQMPNSNHLINKPNISNNRVEVNFQLHHFTRAAKCFQSKTLGDIHTKYALDFSAKNIQIRDECIAKIEVLAVEVFSKHRFMKPW